MVANLQLCPLFSGQQFFDSNGEPLDGGKINSYYANTNTPLSTYANKLGDASNPNPIELDSSGRFIGEIWLEPSTYYKFELTTSDDVVILTMDNIYGMYTGSLSNVSATDGTVSLPSITFNSETSTGFYRIGAGAFGVTVSGTKVAEFKATGGLDVTTSFKVPVGTTAARDASPYDGLLRYNSDLKQFEGYFNSNWQSVGGGQLLGNSTSKAIFWNSQTIAENLTVASGTNGMTAGPITISNTYTVTISDGSVWTVI